MSCVLELLETYPEVRVSGSTVFQAVLLVLLSSSTVAWLVSLLLLSSNPWVAKLQRLSSQSLTARAASQCVQALNFNYGARGVEIWCSRVWALPDSGKLLSIVFELS